MSLADDMQALFGGIEREIRVLRETMLRRLSAVPMQDGTPLQSALLRLAAAEKQVGIMEAERNAAIARAEKAKNMHGETVCLYEARIAVLETENAAPPADQPDAAGEGMHEQTRQTRT